MKREPVGNALGANSVPTVGKGGSKAILSD
jgi:hypothetical protein